MDPELRKIRARQAYASLNPIHTRIFNKGEATSAAESLIESLDQLGHRIDLDHEAEHLISMALRDARALRRWVGK